jgi:hypothetical protein
MEAADAVDPAQSTDSPVPYTLTPRAEALLEQAASPTTVSGVAHACGMAAHDPQAQPGPGSQSCTYVTEISVPPADSGIHRLHARMTRTRARTAGGAVTSGGRYGRAVSEVAFYEWLLSDHPDARAERDRRRAATYQAETGSAAAVRASAGKTGGRSGAPQTLRDVAASMGPQADQAAARAHARYAEPDAAYVTRPRA